MHRSRFCPLCGGGLASRVPPGDDRERLVCASCGFVLYLNPKIAAGTVPVLPDGRIALIRRGVAPGEGLWSWPCGYVERDEDVPACAVRETREECGLDVDLGPLLGLYSYAADMADGMVSGTGMVIACYAARVRGGELRAGDDAADVLSVTPEEIPWDNLAFDSSRRGLRDHLRLRARGARGAGET